jgi:peptidyl-prolyl cis-trans isomerase A (cyclophilin A)
VVKGGIPGQPTGLQLHQIFLRLSEALVADGHPRPVERNIDHASEFVLAYNAAPVQVEVDVPTALHFLDRRVAQLEALATGGAADAAQPASADRAEPADRATPADAAEAVAALPPGPPEVRGAGPHGAAEQQIGTLKASAARFLRERRGEAFRQVEAELQQVGASARPTAILRTTAGDITIELLPDYAPQTVRNFIDLAEGTRPGIDPHLKQQRRTGTGLYDGTIFHRVVAGFMIQGGDPFGSGLGGPGYVLADEFHADLSFDRPYLVAMANTGPNTNGSQFFITVAPAPWLTARHTIFAVVIAGQDVVDEISRMPAARDDRPLEPVTLQTVRVSGDLAG